MAESLKKETEMLDTTRRRSPQNVHKTLDGNGKMENFKKGEEGK